jgi:hypothetical protein
MSEPSEFSESGNPIYRHQRPDKPFEIARGNEENIAAISAHIEKHIGPPDTVFHEIISAEVHLDVHFVAPRPERNFWTLVTSGMSDRPMKAPEGCEHLRYGEMMICLPPDWKMTEEDRKDERNFWPIGNLKFLARLPHAYDTWISFEHTIPNDDPPRNFPGTKFCCSLIGLPQLFPEEFWKFPMAPDKEIFFYTMIPIYREEMELKLKKGGDALWDTLDKHGVNELLDVNRKNVAKKLFGIF